MWKEASGELLGQIREREKAVYKSKMLASLWAISANAILLTLFAFATQDLTLSLAVLCICVFGWGLRYLYLYWVYAAYTRKKLSYQMGLCIDKSCLYSRYLRLYRATFRLENGDRIEDKYVSRESYDVCSQENELIVVKPYRDTDFLLRVYLGKDLMN